MIRKQPRLRPERVILATPVESTLPPPPSMEDPAAALVETLTALGASNQALVDQVARLLEDAKRQASGEIVRRAMPEIAGAVERLVLAYNRATTSRWVALIVLAFLAGIFIGKGM